MGSTTKQVTKKLIRYNRNYLEENNEDEKETIYIDFTKKTDIEDYENFIDFKWIDVQDENEEHITRLTWLRDYKSKLMRSISLNSSLRIVW